jgi:hypothetical protein
VIVGLFENVGSIEYIFRSWRSGSHEHGESHEFGFLAYATYLIVSVIKAEDKLVGICRRNRNKTVAYKMAIGRHCVQGLLTLSGSGSRTFRGA